MAEQSNEMVQMSRHDLETVCYALKRATDLRNLGWNEATTEPGVSDSSGCVRGEYTRAADGIERLIRNARVQVRGSLAALAVVEGEQGEQEGVSHG